MASDGSEFYAEYLGELTKAAEPFKFNRLNDVLLQPIVDNPSQWVTLEVTFIKPGMPFTLWCRHPDGNLHIEFHETAEKCVASGITAVTAAYT